nr:MAG TPA: hypothetical protein [Caudoviricetes sp.]
MSIAKMVKVFVTAKEKSQNVEKKLSLYCK